MFPLQNSNTEPIVKEPLAQKMFYYFDESGDPKILGFEENEERRKRELSKAINELNENLCKGWLIFINGFFNF